MADLNSSSKNITVEGIEQEEEKKPQTQASTFNAKNYLNIKLAKNETKKEIRIRLLPVDKESNTPFKHIHMHTIKVPKEIAESGWKSYVCLEKTEGDYTEKLGKKCPFCEQNRESYNKSQKEGITDVEKKHYIEESLSFKAGEVGIMRCIERGAEEDGPKFWKYNLRKDKKDPESVIKALYMTRKQESIDQEKEDNNGGLPDDFIPMNILDLDEGKDLKVTITAVLDDDGKPTGKTSIDIMDYGKVKPLTNDPELRDKWVNDEKIWSDVFVAKPYEYLKIIMNGEIPWFNKEIGKWVSREEFNKNKEEKKTEETNKADEKIKEAESKITVNNDENEDLPY